MGGLGCVVRQGLNSVPIPTVLENQGVFQEQRMRVGVVGCGLVSEKHIPYLRKMEGIDIVGICDLDEVKANACATLFRIRNVFSPSNPGTLITKDGQIVAKDGVKAVTIVKNVAVITVSGSGMVGAPGTAAKVFEVLGKENINILMISQSVSEANISLVIQRNLLERAVNTLEIALLGRDFIREIVSEDDVCVVAVLGAGMQGMVGVASKIFSAVAKKGINVRMIAQGSSELNVSFVVKEKNGDKTVRAIHKEFKLNQK